MFLALTPTVRYLKVGVYALDLHGERLQRASPVWFVAICVLNTPLTADLGVLSVRVGKQINVTGMF